MNLHCLDVSSACKPAVGSPRAPDGAPAHYERHGEEATGAVDRVITRYLLDQVGLKADSGVRVWR